MQEYIEVGRSRGVIRSGGASRNLYTKIDSHPFCELGECFFWGGGSPFGNEPGLKITTGFTTEISIHIGYHLIIALYFELVQQALQPEFFFFSCPYGLTSPYHNLF